MKKLKWMALFFLAAFFPLTAHAALDAMRISLLEGEVQVYTEETGEWVPASINLPLKEGDRVWAADGGRAELHFKDGTYLRLDQRSALEVLTVERNSFQFYLSTGRLFANFQGRKDFLLQIDAPESSLRAFEKSNFRMDVFDSGRTEITSFRGTLYAESRDGRTQIERGRTLYISERGDAEFGPLPPADEWERWNRQRDTKLAEWRPPSRHLPEELRAYSRDFDDHGRWVHVPEYGQVWTPHVVVSVGWAPYRQGRWVWVGGDYTWISYEPWGWVPYHYGRWSFVASIGWCWVPPLRGAVHWGPGYVGWVITPAHVSWVPLAPREIYYGYGHYGPHSVNITKVNITNIHTEKVVYRNVKVTNAVTVVHRDTFVTGRQVAVRVQENPFLRERVHVGRPDIRPERATKMPVLREISADKKPPAPVREVKVREIKETRPLVRPKEASVMRPGAPARELKVRVREGTPEPRVLEKPGYPPPARTEPARPERARPAGREAEKPGAVRAPEKAVEKPQPRPAAERSGERQRELRGPEREVEKPGALPRPERRIERSRPAQPPERGNKPAPLERRMEQPAGGQPIQRVPERMATPRPPEAGTERPAAQRVRERDADRGRAAEREAERAAEPRQRERGGPEGRGR